MRMSGLMRWAAPAGCLALLGAIAPPAGAHIGATHAPFVTTRPDLLSAVITASGQVKACFDETIAILDAGEFEAQGYDSSTDADGTAASVDPSDSRCALVDMEHPALSQATVFNADEGAVDDTGGSDNSNGAVALQGSTFNARQSAPRKGNTDAPELLSTTVLPGPNRIEFTMDEPVDADTCDFFEFGFNEGNGNPHFGQSCFDVSGSVATIQFDPSDDVESAVRFFILPGAFSFCTFQEEERGGSIYDLGTSDATAGPNPEAKWNTHTAVGGPTADPDLVSVSKVGGNILAFTFDELVQSVRPDCFWAYSDDGDGWSGDSFTQPSATSVNVSFDGIQDAFDQIVRAGVDADAVLDSTNTDGNTYGSFDLETGLARSGAEVPHMGGGYTDGPDLEQAITDKANDTISYCNDEPLHTELADYAPSGFFVYDNAGTETSGQSILSIESNCVRVAFSGGDVDLAVAAGYDEDQDGPWDRLDFPDDCNPDCEGPDANNRSARAVAVRVDGPPPTGAPGAPAPPTTPTPGPPIPIVRNGLCDPTRPTASIAELLIGTRGPDLICGFGGDDSLRGLDGADTLKGQGGGDVQAGGGGEDASRGGPGNDDLRGGSGDDELKGGDGRDTALGGRDEDLCRAETQRGCEA